jgi:hypothetical protein
VQPFKGIGTTQYCSNPCPSDCTCWGIFYFIKMAKEIQLTQGKVALVDDEDYDYLMQWKWCVCNKRFKFYAVRNIPIFNNKQTIISMHRLIMKPDKDMLIDHLDGNTFNNQKKNLRICTHSENMRNSKIPINNTSGYKGVSLIKNTITEKWMATIRFNNKKNYLGSFNDPVDAARAYNAAALKYHGEFAHVNIID